MLGETMKYVAPIASKAGASIEQASAMAGMLGDVGIQGSEAGTALRAAFLRLADPPKEAAKAMQALGVAVTDSSGKIRPINQIMLDLHKSTSTLANGKQLEYISTIFGAEAASGMMELVSNAQKLDDRYKDIAINAGGAADKIALIMGDNYAGRVQEMESAMEGLHIAIGDLLLPVLKAKVEKLTGWIQLAETWVQSNKAIVRTVLELAAKTASLITAFGVVAIATASIITPLAYLRYGLLRFTVGLGLFRGAFALVSGLLVAGLTRWQQVLPTVTRYFPALGAWLGQHLPQASYRMAAAWQALKQVWGGATFWGSSRLEQFRQISMIAFNVDPVKKYGQAATWLSGVWGQALAQIRQRLPLLREQAQSVFAAVSAWMVTNGAKIKAVVSGVMVKALDQVSKAMTWLSLKAKDGSVQRWLDAAARHIQPLLTNIIAFGRGIWNALAGIRRFVVGMAAFVGGWENMGKIFVGLALVSKFAALLSGIASVLAIVQTLGAIVWATGAALLAFGGWVASTGIFATIAAKAVLLYHGAMAALARVLPMVGRAILFMSRALLLNPIGLAITAIAGAAYLIYSNWGRIGPWFAGLWGRVKASFANARAALSNMTWGQIANKIVSAFVSLPGNMLKMGVEAIGKLAVGIMTSMGVPESRARAVVAHVVGALTSLPSKMMEMGKQAIQGLADGIKAAGARALDAAKQIASDIGSAVKGFFDIQSPSRLMMGYGGHISQGLAIGISAEGKQAIAQAKSLSERVSQQVKPLQNNNVVAFGAARQRLRPAPAQQSALPPRESLVTGLTKHRQELAMSGETKQHVGGEIRVKIDVPANLNTSAKVSQPSGSKVALTANVGRVSW